jgi:hypothetical protein
MDQGEVFREAPGGTRDKLREQAGIAHSFLTRQTRGSILSNRDSPRGEIVSPGSATAGAFARN